MDEQHCDRCSSYGLCPCPKCEDTYEDVNFGSYDDPAPEVSAAIPTADYLQCWAILNGGEVRCRRAVKPNTNYCHNHQNWVIKEKLERYCLTCQVPLPVWRSVNSKYCSKKCNKKSYNKEYDDRRKK